MTNTAPAPRIVDVKVARDTDDHCTGSNNLWSVTPVWAGVDLPDNFGWIVRGERLARRLDAAVRAGVVFGPAEVCTNIKGKTYVNASSRVLGRTLNADLRRLGY
jgi:hypothetical protein